ncbi:MAG: hypothetical protein QGF00_08190 [Planctomycetota bacterium]|jgi:hypothetical protein|nr:hypothetical protein [Planctomycetota bacterium]MDP7249566.1 hypothetical protein [Planctomycetota bacterium]
MATEREPFEGFFEEDFEMYLPPRRKDRKFNDDRLLIKHRLHSLGELIAPGLGEAGLDLDFKTSLSHPYTFNKFSVDSQWVYFARKEKETKPLKKLFGEFLGKDLDMHYCHVILVAEINLDGVELALKIHQQAWWDGQNVKNRCNKEDARKKLTDALNQQSGFILSIHNWKKEYVCGKLTHGDVANYMKYYTPGNHWFHLRMSLPKETVIPMEAGFAEFAGEKLAGLAPIYKLIEWRKDNDCVFGGG